MNRNNLIRVILSAGLAMAFTALTGCAPVTLSSKPSGADVFDKKSDKHIGTTPLKVNLVANEQELVVRKDGYFSKTVVLSPIDPKNIEVELNVRDKVLILSTPKGADLYVEGVGRVGRTPYHLDYEKPYRSFLVKAAGYDTQLFTVPEDPEGHVLIDLVRGNTVTVKSDPANASIVSEAGEVLGMTPLAIPATDSHTYIIRKEGYYEQKFSVDEDTESPYTVKLEREPIVIVESEPENAVVVHRGVMLGQTPFRQLVEGDMELSLELNRYYTKKITISPSSPRNVKVQLEKQPYVTINSIPPGGTLYRDGGVEKVGETPVEILIEKDIALEMHLKGYKVKSFTLSPESDRSVSVPMEKDVGIVEKTITIDSDPSGALVYRPGGAELIGKTPLKQRISSERTYELQKKGYETKIVTVAPDSQDNVVFALAKDESAGNVTVSDPLLNTPSSF